MQRIFGNSNQWFRFYWSLRFQQIIHPSLQGRCSRGAGGQSSSQFLAYQSTYLKKGGGAAYAHYSKMLMMSFRVQFVLNFAQPM